MTEKERKQMMHNSLIETGYVYQYSICNHEVKKINYFDYYKHLKTNKIARTDKFGMIVGCDATKSYNQNIAKF